MPGNGQPTQFLRDDVPAAVAGGQPNRPTSELRLDDTRNEIN